MEIEKLKKIVYAEDEPDIRMIGEMALQMEGWQIVACASGLEAIQIIKAQMPDLVILDVMMPGLDGPTTLKVLRENPKTASIPIVFMTAKVQSTEIDHFKKIGAHAVIPKPFDPMTLVNDIKKIWLTI